jgi:hypothetical protein
MQHELFSIPVEIADQEQALTNYLKALIDLYRQDGSLLERRRIPAPGREPVKLSKK